MATGTRRNRSSGGDLTAVGLGSLSSRSGSGGSRALAVVGLDTTSAAAAVAAAAATVAAAEMLVTTATMSATSSLKTAVVFPSLLLRRHHLNVGARWLSLMLSQLRTRSPTPTTTGTVRLQLGNSWITCLQVAALSSWALWVFFRQYSPQLITPAVRATISPTPVVLMLTDRRVSLCPRP